MTAKADIQYYDSSIERQTDFKKINLIDMQRGRNWPFFSKLSMNQIRREEYQ